MSLRQLCGRKVIKNHGSKKSKSRENVRRNYFSLKHVNNRYMISRSTTTTT